MLKELIAEARESGTLTEPVRRLFRERAADLVSSVTSEPERRFLFASSRILEAHFTLILTPMTVMIEKQFPRQSVEYSQKKSLLNPTLR